jgi:hypothetical protein
MNKRAWKSLLVVISDPFSSEQPALIKAVALAHRSGSRLVAESPQVRGGRCLLRVLDQLLEISEH